MPALCTWLSCKCDGIGTCGRAPWRNGERTIGRERERPKAAGRETARVRAGDYHGGRSAFWQEGLDLHTRRYLPARARRRRQCLRSRALRWIAESRAAARAEGPRRGRFQLSRRRRRVSSCTRQIYTRKLARLAAQVRSSPSAAHRVSRTVSRDSRTSAYIREVSA